MALQPFQGHICAYWRGLMFAYFMVRVAVAQIDPEFAVNITVYHLNPKEAGSIPLNMNSGDPRGDMKFYLWDFAMPLACKNDSAIYRIDCQNPERQLGGLVVTKVDMEVDSRYTQYVPCNLCSTGKDPFGRECVKGEYWCMTDIPLLNKSRVGRTNLTLPSHNLPNRSCIQAREGMTCEARSSEEECEKCFREVTPRLKEAGCRDVDIMTFRGDCLCIREPYSCWASGLYLKMGGLWYSTLRQGLCEESSPVGNCSWRPWATRTINETCLRESIVSLLEEERPRCFQDCGPRNESSSCWIHCAFEALLGAAVTKGSDVGGVPVARLVQTWEGAFDPEMGIKTCAPVDMQPIDLALSMPGQHRHTSQHHDSDVSLVLT